MEAFPDDGPAGKLCARIGNSWIQPVELPVGADLQGAADINLEELNQFRQAVLQPILPFRQAFLEEDATVESITQALKEYLEQADARGKLEWYQSRFEAQGQESLAKEYSQAYDFVEELFRTADCSFGKRAGNQERICGNSGCRFCGNPGRLPSGCH